MALDEWMASREGTLGPNTQRDYDLTIRNQLKPLRLPDGLAAYDSFVPFSETGGCDSRLGRSRHSGGPARAVDLQDHRVLGQLPVELFTDVIANGVRNQMLKEGLGVKRVNNLVAPLRGAMARLATQKRIGGNPFDLLKPLKKPSPSVRADVSFDVDVSNCPDGLEWEDRNCDPFTTDELAAINNHLCEAMVNQVIFTAWSGLRTGEVIGLRAADVDLVNGRILVRRSVSRGIEKSTKTDKPRHVNLLPPARAALESQLRKMQGRDGWVFPNPATGRRWANDSKITKRWQKALKAAGVRYRRPYQLRHTYASMLLSAGENPLYVAQQMGHSDWSMVVKVYGRWIPSGAAQPGGALVTAANRTDWERFGLDESSSRRAPDALGR
jgi:integrase